jgi:hypothetical protein
MKAGAGRPGKPDDRLFSYMGIGSHAFFTIEIFHAKIRGILKVGDWLYE